MKKDTDAIRQWLKESGVWEKIDHDSDRLQNIDNEILLALSKTWAKNLREKAKRKLGEFVCSGRWQVVEKDR